MEQLLFSSASHHQTRRLRFFESCFSGLVISVQAPAKDSPMSTLRAERAARRAEIREAAIAREEKRLKV